MNRKEANILRKTGFLLFIIYLGGMVYFLFFAESMGRTISGREYSYNLVLFKEIKRFAVYHKELGIMAVATNLLGNILCFVPFGCLFPVLSRKGRKLLAVGLACLEFSLLIEIMQLVLKVGSFDVDDLLLNTAGGVMGYGLYRLGDKIRRKLWPEKKK